MVPLRRLALAALAFLGLASCHGEVPLTAPEGATITIEANPKSIPAVGGRSTITVIGFKAAEDGGGTLADGTQIFFTSDLGAIEQRVEMRSGIAQATLQSDGRSGTATITAQSGGGITAGTTTVQIGAGAEGDLVITVTANPSTLGPTDVTAEIVATVTDNRGNPVPDVPVIFSTDSGALASQGSVLRTNVNGQAFDRVTLLATDASATITVTSGSSTGTVTVNRGDFADPAIDSIFPASGSPGDSDTVTISGRNFQPGATVSFGAGIFVEDVRWINSETIEADIEIDDFASPGAQTVTVTNPDGAQGTFDSGFTISGPPTFEDPVCAMTVSPLGTPSGSGSPADPWQVTSANVNFNGTASDDPDGGTIAFDWDFGDGTPNSTSSAPAHMFAAAATYGVTLTVTDDEGATCSITEFVEVP